MSIYYTIDCRHCGSHTTYEGYANLRSISRTELSKLQHIDTEEAIRCPKCRSRLNTTEAEFRAQVKVECN